MVKRVVERVQVKKKVIYLGGNRIEDVEGSTREEFGEAWPDTSASGNNCHLPDTA